MSNMSYCRFQNTAPDLKDCLDNMEEINPFDEFLSDNDRAELRARRRLIKYCVIIANLYGHELEEDE